jgi:hypothetical protein
MLYKMTLVIVGASNTDVTVVNGPVALLRGGAIPVALVRFISYRREDGFSSDIPGARGIGNKEVFSPRVAELVNAVALDATGGNALRVRTPSRGPTSIVGELVCAVSAFCLPWL